MPSIEFYATFEESIAILRDLCGQGFRVIPDPGPRDEPSAPSFETVTDDLVSILDKAPGYYLAGSFTDFPVQFNQLKTGPKAGKYAINVLAGGPLMQCQVARVKELEGEPRILPGVVSYQKSYLNPETGAWEGPSTKLVDAFRKAVSAVKKVCRPAKDKPSRFIAPLAAKLLESGEAKLG